MRRLTIKLLKGTVKVEAAQKNLGCFFYISNQLKPQTLTQGGENMRRLNKKGQSTLEYILIWTAIVAALVVAATTGPLKDGISNALNSMGGKIESETTVFSENIGSTAP